MNYNEKLAEKVSEYIRSEAYLVVKYKTNLLIDRLKNDCVNEARQGNNIEASVKAGIVEGLRLSIEATEHLVRELKEEKLDANAVLGVIENKTEGEAKWEMKSKLSLLQRILRQKKK